MFTAGLPSIARLRDTGLFEDIDLHLAGLLCRLSGGDDPLLALSTSLVSRAIGQGNTCLDLRLRGGEMLPLADGSTLNCPPTEDWALGLKQFPVVGRPGAFAPLILADKRLYLYRYFQYEQQLVDDIKRLALAPSEELDEARLAEGIRRLFPDGDPSEIDWQRVAAFVAVRKRLCVISGGPGTGKTTTVARILALILEQHPDVRIALAAPTGKAAARLSEAMVRAKGDLALPEDVLRRMPLSASTIHRLLKVVPHSPTFAHNRRNPLPLDLLVVDEVSMVDLPLMAKLVEALPEGARLILLGDKDQLASVEAGAVMGEICAARDLSVFSADMVQEIARVTGHQPKVAREAGLGDCVIQLTRNYRFPQSSGIGAVSHDIRLGHGSRALQRAKKGFDDLTWTDLAQARDVGDLIAPLVEAYYVPALRESDPAKAFDLLEQFQILCPIRHGPLGVEALNALVEEILWSQRVIDPQGRWYRGRPILITRNDYSVKLFNGDVGLVLPHEGELKAFFRGGDGRFRTISLVRLPEHETVYAMTVHKSQGSEFDHVMVVLPPEETAVLTRELLYTAITRARRSVRILGQEEIFRGGVGRRNIRESGLRYGLWGKDARGQAGQLELFATLEG